MLEPRTEAELRGLLKKLKGDDTSKSEDGPALPTLMDAANLATKLLGVIAGAAGICYLFGFIIFNTHVSQFGLHSFELASPTFFLAGLSFIGLMLLPLMAFVLLPSIISITRADETEALSHNLQKLMKAAVFFLIFVEIGLVAMFSLAFALGDFVSLNSLYVAVALLFLTFALIWGGFNGQQARRGYYLLGLPIVQISALYLLVTIGAPENAPAYYAAGGVLLVSALASAAQGVFVEFFSWLRDQTDAWVIVVIGIVALTIVTLLLSFVVPIWARQVYPMIDHSFGGGDLKGATVRVAFMEEAKTGGPVLRSALESELGFTFADGSAFSPPLQLLEDGGRALIVLIERADQRREVLRLPRAALAGVIYGTENR